MCMWQFRDAVGKIGADLSMSVWLGRQRERSHYLAMTGLKCMPNF